MIWDYVCTGQHWTLFLQSPPTVYKEYHYDFIETETGLFVVYGTVSLCCRWNFFFEAVTLC